MIIDESSDTVRILSRSSLSKMPVPAGSRSAILSYAGSLSPFDCPAYDCRDVSGAVLSAAFAVRDVLDRVSFFPFSTASPVPNQSITEYLFSDAIKV